MSNRPGGELAARPLHFIWIVDCSGSMSGDKIESLNTAIKESIPSMRKVANENPNANVLVRAIKFSDGAQWHIAQPMPVASFNWADLSADGLTDMGKALRMVADQLKMPPMADRALPPVLVLMSDGQPTDDFAAGLNALNSEPWGKRAVRVAIGIGQDADLDVLQRFIGNSEIKPLQANNAETLVRYIKWASTAVLKTATAPGSQTSNPALATTVPAAALANLPPVPPPPDPAPTADDDVW